MKITDGDLINIALNGDFDVIIHGCNCFCKMRNGIAKQIANTFPDAEKMDSLTTIGDRAKLGQVTTSTFFNYNLNTFVIVNAYTQYGINRDGSELSYPAIRSCFKEVKRLFSGLRIGYPKIGAGLAGGDWNIVSKIIDEELEGEDHTLVIFNPEK